MGSGPPLHHLARRQMLRWMAGPAAPSSGIHRLAPPPPAGLAGTLAAAAPGALRRHARGVRPSRRALQPGGQQARQHCLSVRLRRRWDGRRSVLRNGYRPRYGPLPPGVARRLHGPRCRDLAPLPGELRVRRSQRICCLLGRAGQEGGGARRRLPVADSAVSANSPRHQWTIPPIGTFGATGIRVFRRAKRGEMAAPAGHGRISRSAGFTVQSPAAAPHSRRVPVRPAPIPARPAPPAPP